MLDLDETFCKASLGYFEDPDTISSSIKNIPGLLEEMLSLDKALDVGS